MKTYKIIDANNGMTLDFIKAIGQIQAIRRYTEHAGYRINLIAVEI